MSQPTDFLFGKIALREGLITQEQLFDSLHVQERNPAKTLGAIMIQRGYLTQEDVAHLLNLQKKEIERTGVEGASPHRPLLGALLIQKGLASEYQVNECLRLQGRLAEMGMKPVPMLGEVLLRRGYLKPIALETALQIQGLSLYSCPECGHSLELNITAQPDGSYRCGHCGSGVPALFAKMAGAAQHALRLAADRLDLDLPQDIREAGRDPKNHFGKYILVKEIGRGGTGIVYKAWEKDRNAIVALKLLPHESETAAGVKTPYGDAEDVKRFYSETRAAAHLEHEHIVPILDFGMIENHFYFTMKHIEGTTLDEIIREGGKAFKTTLRRPGAVVIEPSPEAKPGAGLPPYTAFALILPLVRATAFAHEQGIHHRDIKPGNILIDRDQHPWLMDFGLAKVVHLGDPAYVKGVIMGTPYYMPPEQATGDMEQVDDKSDIYSLGAVLYELVSGRCPFHGKSADEVLDLIEKTRPDPILTLVPELPKDGAQIIQRAMMTSKRDRYRSAVEMAEDIERFLEGHPLKTRSGPGSGLLDKVRTFFRKPPHSNP